MHDRTDASQSGKSVCIVDDEIDITSVIKKGLEQHGFKVHAFNDPRKAWDYFQANGRDFSVVVSDIRMPGMSGFELCRKIKELRPETPVILMTAFEINRSEFSKVFPHTTPDDLLCKPITVKKLKETIDGLTAKAKLQ